MAYNFNVSYRSRPGQAVDPLRRIYGNPFEGFGQPIFVRGIVIGVSSGKCTVTTEDGSCFHGLDWPNTDQSPGGSGCMVAPPEVGAPVIVRKSATGAIISQTLTLSSPTTANKPYSVSDSNVDNIAMSMDGSTYTNILPSDAMPGDRVQVGNQGQKVGILEGGVALLSASPWCGVRALQKDDTLQILGRNLEIQTGFGQIKFTDIAGKNSFLFEGGTDRLTETGTGQNNWTVRAAIGRTSQYFADFQLKKSDGDNLYWMSVDSDGSMRQDIAGEHNLYIENRKTETIGTGRQTVISAGDDQLDIIEGDGRVSCGGTYQIEPGKNLSMLVGNDITEMAIRDLILSAGRNMAITTSGNTLAKPKDKAVLWNVSNGDFVIDIGAPFPAGSDLVKSLSGFDVTSWMGDIQFHALGPAGKIVLDTTMPASSVMLGSILGVAPFHATKFEQLAALVNALLTALDTHTHPTGVGPSGTPIVPLTPSISPLVQPMMSLKVLLGA